MQAAVEATRRLVLRGADPISPQQKFRSQIVTAGPQGEPDFENTQAAWYWCQRVIRNESATGVADLYISAGDGVTVAAINLLEIGTGPDGHGTHAIVRKRARDAVVPQRIVDVVWNPFEQQYEFESFPGAILPWYALDLTGMDDNGCPCSDDQFHLMYGPGIVDPEVEIPECPP